MITITKRWHGRLGSAALLLAVVLVGLAITEVFLIGLVFLVIPHTPENSGTCDEVRQSGGQWQCIVYLHGPGDEITVLKRSPQL
jgi:hypothetical protein